MSISLSVYAYRSGHDPEYKSKADAVKALKKAGVELPESLQKYFDISSVCEFVENESGLEVANSYRNKDIFYDIQDPECTTIEVDLSKLPEGTKFIRVKLG